MTSNRYSIGSTWQVMASSHGETFFVYPSLSDARKSWVGDRYRHTILVNRPLKPLTRHAVGIVVDLVTTTTTTRRLPNVEEDDDEITFCVVFFVNFQGFVVMSKLDVTEMMKEIVVL